MIVGTAGHIDHGKTTLVKALTGVDTDRLPQEKARGISIELGYAFLDLPAPPGAAPGEAPPRIGFIDVPGHERLVHTMLAGATGIDHALLLVAADDGVMPQTREHLAVLSLLGLAQGTVVLTKADRADAARLEAVRGEVAQLLAPTPLAAAPVLAVSATTGGLPALRTRLAEAAAAARRAADPQALFRLAIDRVFSLDGIGTVVTGTVHAGAVEVGDELCLVPGDAGTVVRVRSLHAQNRPVTRAAAGQRCALNLAGPPVARAARRLAGDGPARTQRRLRAAARPWQPALGAGPAHRDKVRPILARGVADGVWARDLARDTQEPEALMRTTLARLAQRGELHQVVRDLCYDEATLRGLARLARGVAEAHGGEVTAAGFRDATGLGRKRAIQILEYFDRIGLLRRVGDVHRLRRDTALFGEDEA
ncbi:selenocysteine-specific translation elongation factor [Piscinibacter sakaiensis]|uniref:selenocysteine-specific translation elongation factor n=1 Tax=Piscinibacter sakaiensis TaxID=1547922 RepID=UPI00372C3DEB